MTKPPALPEACSNALATILANPSHPGATTEAHLNTCPACSMARVTFLAQEESPEVEVPSGYFERLPERLLRKLPARTKAFRLSRLHPLGWAAAAVLLMAVGAGAFWVGRANQAPYVEAGLSQPPTDPVDAWPESPFDESEDALTRLRALSPEDAEAVFRSLSATHATPRPAHP